MQGSRACPAVCTSACHMSGKPGDSAPVQVEEACIHCSEDGRDEALYYLLAAHPGRTLVFVNAVSAARRVAALLALLRLPAAALHASMQQRARLRALDRFRTDETAVLVASDVAARGLDVAVGFPCAHCAPRIGFRVLRFPATGCVCSARRVPNGSAAQVRCFP